MKRVILVEDNAIDQHLYRRMIERSGLVEEVISFDLATDALTYLSVPHTPRPDLILLDVNLPKMDGFEFLEALRARFGDRDFNVVVMLTTSLSIADADRAAGFCAVRDYLNKPLTPIALKEIIENSRMNMLSSGWQAGALRTAPETFAARAG